MRIPTNLVSGGLWYQAVYAWVCWRKCMVARSLATSHEGRPTARWGRNIGGRVCVVMWSVFVSLVWSVWPGRGLVGQCVLLWCQYQQEDHSTEWVWMCCSCPWLSWRIATLACSLTISPSGSKHSPYLISLLKPSHISWLRRYFVGMELLGNYSQTVVQIFSVSWYLRFASFSRSRKLTPLGTTPKQMGWWRNSDRNDIQSCWELW